MSDIVERLREAEERFHASYKRGLPNECWLWRGAVYTPSGYGRFAVARTSLPASRAAIMLRHGKLGRFQFVCHTFDNRLCVNPKHLWIGTPKDNAQDMVRKKRQVTPIGAANPMTKLSEDEVRQIRTSNLGHRPIARLLRVDESLIRQIRKGKWWNHVRM